MSSALGISTSGSAAASLQRQAPARNVANASDTAPVADANTSSTAGPPPAAVSSRVKPAAAPSVDLSNEIAQQVATSHAVAANAKAVQAGSSTISPVLDITV